VLPSADVAVNVRAMRAFARLLQLAGLTILPLALLAELGHRIDARQLLRFLIVGACLFTAGYLLQQYGGRRP